MPPLRMVRYRPSTRCGVVGLESPSDKAHVHAMNEWPGPGSALRGSASKLTGHLPGSLENGRSRPRHSLISSLIHLRTPASIGVYRRSLSSQGDLRGRSCTVIRTTEKRKVGGSTPPLTTHYHQRIMSANCEDADVWIVSSLPACDRSRPPVPATGRCLVHAGCTGTPGCK